MHAAAIMHGFSASVNLIKAHIPGYASNLHSFRLWFKTFFGFPSPCFRSTLHVFTPKVVCMN